NAINKLDSSYHFTGVSTIVAPEAGYVTGLLHQAGDYVQDGEQLASISKTSSFGFMLNVPYELHAFLPVGKAVMVILPDHTHLPGKIASFLPAMDSISQTQQAVVRVNASASIPENLVARVRFLKDQRRNTTSVPKAAVLSNDAQTEFWIMKLIDSGTAVKTDVEKGLETNDRIEIIRPVLSPNDKIVTAGNYGLNDTAKVKIVKTEQ
ncbi:MAG TPA: HlyD family efflux transporter periplasmic adaptor subunit, partial [Chitinophagaceae bacterium]